MAAALLAVAFVKAEPSMTLHSTVTQPQSGVRAMPMQRVMSMAAPPETRADIPLAVRARARLLQMHYESKVGHIGGNLSALDALLHLHCRVMSDDDLFVLSKGHAAGALYIALWAAGLLDENELRSFHQDGTRLAGHPVAGWHKRIPFATGSLGHGLGLAAGAALARQLRGDPGTVYCLLSDGECEEGSTWESILLAHHRKLANLVILVDANGLQGFGSTAEVASLEPLAPKFRAFGMQVVEIDGHAPAALDGALEKRRAGPLVVLMRTVKGRGVSFMEGRMEWHYLPLNDAQYAAALRELGVL
ncbi:MAG TPA: 1-deoxy-D-xylulose-5-phosphate synthase N-terminal domain-containing protein [Stellaceae bacterium]|nr:1-deoxy-D-xylulose-5-phosphate synthase N-terminal domain-containing protein [Stellaceae bacterium]